MATAPNFSGLTPAQLTNGSVHTVAGVRYVYHGTHPNGAFVPTPSVTLEDHIGDLTNPHQTTAPQVDVTPTGNLNSTNVQDALEELQTDLDNLVSGAVNYTDLGDTPAAYSVAGDLVRINPGNNGLIFETPGVANGIPELDATGKVPSGQLPALAITDVQTGTLAARPAIGTVQEGDVYITTDTNQSFISDGTTWLEMQVPTDATWTAVETNINVQVTSTDGGTYTWVGATPAVAGTGGEAGLLTAVDKEKLDGIEALATADQVASEVPVTAITNVTGTDVQAVLEELSIPIVNDVTVRDEPLVRVLDATSANYPDGLYYRIADGSYVMAGQL